jgi:inner membrane protein
MDSLTQIALGAAVGTVVLGRRVGPRAALWGAICGTLPDLDVLVPYGDPVRDFTLHRAESHSLFWLTVAAPFVAALPAWLHRGAGVAFRHWWLLAWLALVTHPLLDAFTVYGTQLLLPFSDYPVGAGSIFIIDPLYTLPLLAGLAVSLRLHARRPERAARWNAAGLAVSTLYLAWTVAAQSHVEGVVHRTLAATPLAHARTLVTPSPFNSLLWRVVVVDEGGYHEGFHSLLDGRSRVEFVRHASDARLLEPLRDEWAVQRLAWFSKGFYGVSEGPPGLRVAESSASSLSQLLGLVDTASAAATMPGPGSVPVVMTDLRMGQTPWFVFSFVVGERDEEQVRPLPPQQVPAQRPPPGALRWLWQRIRDGSGGDGPNDLTVTTSGTAPSVGDTVVATEATGS